MTGIYSKDPTIIKKWGVITITSLYYNQVREIRKQLMLRNSAFRKVRVLHLKPSHSHNGLDIPSGPAPDILIHSASRTSGSHGILNEEKIRFTKYIEGQPRFMRIILCNEPYWHDHMDFPDRHERSWQSFIRRQRKSGLVRDVNVFGAPEMYVNHYDIFLTVELTIYGPVTSATNSEIGSSSGSR